MDCRSLGSPLPFRMRRRPVRRPSRPSQGNRLRRLQLGRNDGAAGPGAGVSPPAAAGRLDLEDDWENHRPAAGPLADQLADGVVDVLLQELQLGDVLGEAVREGALGLVARLVEE
jgi:hypothetical protein